MANIKLTDITKILKDAVRNAGSVQTLTEVGNKMVEQIKTRTRLGKGVNKPEGNTSRLKQLEPKTRYNRRLLKKSGKLTGPGATPARSGLNRSGQMLDSLDSKVSQNNIDFELNAEGQRKADAVQKIDPNGFTFMNLSKGEIKQVVEIINDAINDIDKKFR